MMGDSHRSCLRHDSWARDSRARASLNTRMASLDTTRITRMMSLNTKVASFRLLNHRRVRIVFARILAILERAQHCSIKVARSLSASAARVKTPRTSACRRVALSFTLTASCDFRREARYSYARNALCIRTAANFLCKHTRARESSAAAILPSRPRQKRCRLEAAFQRRLSNSWRRFSE